MNYPRYQSFFNADWTPIPIKVLRSRNPALVLCFLQEAFKADNYSPALTNERLVGNLADFLEIWGDADDDSLISVMMSYDEKATKLIKDWVREGYLTLYTNDQGDDLHSLTPDMETVLGWVASLMQKRSFVGTESRFLDIVQKLRELVPNTADCPAHQVH
ncbi:DUF3375 family protein [Spirosoma foliorum]|uniref:DUF3375 family protein n=1 Tax=Spirosoma foliorum TaxID=2710596 RepID=A0A7G5GWG3_9BACT|nr:DUF3375 family protein [Spirosoma foliorum]QMW03205.1 DUF3375 family protein [Spirosoma foliorum]